MTLVTLTTVPDFVWEAVPWLPRVGSCSLVTTCGKLFLLFVWEAVPRMMWLADDADDADDGRMVRRWSRLHFFQQRCRLLQNPKGLCEQI